MGQSSRFVLGVLLIAALALGAFQGRRITQLRESQAFYHWILAAGTNERLFQDASEEYEDAGLFQDIAKKVDPLLPEVARQDSDSELSSKLALTIATSEHDDEVWGLARGSELSAEREAFLGYLSARKLMFTTDIAYAEAQAGGVNLFNLFFGFRKIAANFVWLQVDRFWHQGMMHRMIPLMKTCVTLDPNFIDAYLLGAWHLAYNATANMDVTPMVLKQWNPKYQACVGERELFYFFATDFLKDGIRNNPRDYRLYFDLGFAVYKNKLEDYPNSVKYLREAVRQPHDVWVPRQLYICMELNGQYEEALAGWQDYQKRFPESTSGTDTAPRFIKRNRAHIFEQQAQEAIQAAEAATDPAVATAKRDEAESLYLQARVIWEELSEDTFAKGRILRMDALRLADEKRYLEAIAMLDKARWDSAGLWDEASELIIAYKEAAGIPLSVSEKKSVLREQEGGDRCQGMPEDAVAKTPSGSAS